MRILGIETSCDDTAMAVIEGGDLGEPPCRIIAQEVASQTMAHAPYGGVVPEIASREHIGRIGSLAQSVVQAAGGWEQLDGVAATRGPGLLGALLVGLQFGKSIALARGLPWVGVHHLEGHLCASWLVPEPPKPPYVALLASGGHTHLYGVQSFGNYRLLGQTRDDAAGEAFDKVAKLMGLGYPGGAPMERAAQGGDTAAFALPRALWGRQDLDFSYSGLKTAAAQLAGALDFNDADMKRNFAASVQEAIVAPMVRKAIAAALSLGSPGIVLAGGVAANGRLREAMAEACAAEGLWSFAPPRPLCTDNAAMIAAAGYGHLARGERSAWSEGAVSRWPLGDEA